MPDFRTGSIAFIRSTGRLAYRHLPTVILWAVFIVLLLYSIGGVADVGRMFHAFSLRYDNGISGQAALAARQYAVDNAADADFWPASFWRVDDNTSATSETGSASITCIRFSGDGALAWDADFVRGAMPGVTDTDGCAISNELASELFGSTDVVGMTVTIDSSDWTVRGVFNNGEDLALLSVGDESTATSWQAAELTVVSGSPVTKSDAISFASASGMGRPSVALDGGNITEWARIAAFLPIIILVVFGLISLIRFVPRGIRAVVVFAVCLAFALFLPTLLDLLPGWAVPDMWSDFSFWSSLGTQFTTSMKEFLGMTPLYRDVEGRLILIRQAGLCFATVLCAAVLCVISFHQGIGRKTQSPKEASGQERFTLQALGRLLVAKGEAAVEKAGHKAEGVEAIEGGDGSSVQNVEKEGVKRWRASH